MGGESEIQHGRKNWGGGEGKKAKNSCNYKNGKFTNVTNLLKRGSLVERGVGGRRKCSKDTR